MTGTDLARALGWDRRPLGDQRLWGTGTVTAVDDQAARLEVDIAGMRTMLPRLDGDYEVGDAVVILRDPTASGAGQIVLATVAAIRAIPDPPAALPATGTVTVVGASSLTVSTTAGLITCSTITSTTFAVGNTVLILWDSLGSPWAIGVVGVYTPPPAVPPTPAAPTLSRSGGTVTVDWDSVARATSYRVRYSSNGGSSWTTKIIRDGTATKLSVTQGKTLTVGVAGANATGISPYSGSSSVSYPVPPPTTETVKTTIKPKWSGTWRTDRAAWDRWNTDRYGGRSTMYQGSAYGSGNLEGLAVYGTQLRDLGADSIDAITVSLVSAGLSGTGGPTVTLQGSPQGSKPGGAPSSSGATVSGTPTEKVSLPSSIREAFRTGDVRGLALVGSNYQAVRGTSAAAGMVLTVTYTRKR